MKAISRVMKTIKDKGLTAYKVEKDLGLSNGYLGTVSRRDGDIGETILIKLSDYFDFSLIWLITGEGPMLKPDAGSLTRTAIPVEKPDGSLKDELLDLYRQVNELRQENAKLRELKSVQPVHHRAGAAELKEGG